MNKKRYLTIQLIPHDAKKISILKLRYGFVKFLFYAFLLLFTVILIFIINFSKINMKALSSEKLVEKNKILVENQKKIDSLEKELNKIQHKTKIIENALQSFTYPDSPISYEAPEQSRMELLTKRQLQAYISAIDSIQQQRPHHQPAPRKYTPCIWPVNGIITNPFRQKHNGIDIISKLNSLIAATAEGIVVESSWHRDLGKMVKINHGGYYQTLYGHLNRIYVKVGDHVSRGKPIGTLGNTGNSTGPHLHYEIHHQNCPVDPNNFIGK